MLEAGVQMGFETKFTDDGVMVAVNMCVDAIHSLEDLTDHTCEGLWEWNTCLCLVVVRNSVTCQHTDSARENCLVVDIALDPSHQVFDVSRSGHFGGPFVGFGILPKVLKSTECQDT